MSGFGTVIGAMFSFFILMGVFVGIFYIENNMVGQQIVSLNNMQSNIKDTLYNRYDIDNYFYSSGRFNFLIKNKGSNDFLMKKKIEDNFCFNVYFNNKLINTSNYFFNVINYPLPYNYFVLKRNEKGILSVKYNYSKLPTSTAFDFYSCINQKREFNYSLSKFNWFNLSFKNRKIINITNPYNKDLAEYQIKLNFDSSNIDFSTLNPEEIRPVISFNQLKVLDVPMDTYKQKLNDYSKYNNEVYLGSDSTIESSDPSSTQGVIFKGLKFDGVNDSVSVYFSKNLNLTKEITISSWILWDNSSNETLNNIYTNGGWGNALRIVNDGGIYQNKVLFQLNINGTVNYLYSNTAVNDHKWHLVTATYDGVFMKIYIDGKLDSSKEIIGDIVPYPYENFIGTEGTNYFYKGLMDEVQVYSVALSSNEVKELYNNNLKFRVLKYFVYNYNPSEDKFDLFVKLPILLRKDNLSIELYYNYNSTNIKDLSNLTQVFTYKKPRLIGYIGFARIADTTGLSILSLMDNNTIIVGNNTLHLNFMQSATLSTSQINMNDSIYVKGLAQLEGGGNADDIIAPISFSGKHFYYRGFRSGSDTYCMISPFGDAWVELYDAGSLLWNGTVNNSGLCKVFNVGTSDQFAAISTLPITVSYVGGTTYDAFQFYHATDKDLYGIPSNYLLVAAGVNGSKTYIYFSDGSTNYCNLGENGSCSFSGLGSSGSAPGVRLRMNIGGNIGAIQQADHDGTESTVFVSKESFSTLFGSAFSAEYVTLVSDYKDADCSVYNASGLIGNVKYGVGANGIYKYDFGTGNDNTYVKGPFYVKCKKPVWGYYEEDVDGDETNMIGYGELKQYVYPSPYVSSIE